MSLLESFKLWWLDWFENRQLTAQTRLKINSVNLTKFMPQPILVDFFKFWFVSQKKNSHLKLFPTDLCYLEFFFSNLFLSSCSVVARARHLFYAFIFYFEFILLNRQSNTMSDSSQRALYCGNVYQILMEDALNLSKSTERSSATTKHQVFGCSSYHSEISRPPHLYTPFRTHSAPVLAYIHEYDTQMLYALIVCACVLCICARLYNENNRMV